MEVFVKVKNYEIKKDRSYSPVRRLSRGYNKYAIRPYEIVVLHHSVRAQNTFNNTVEEI